MRGVLNNQAASSTLQKLCHVVHRAVVCNPAVFLRVVLGHFRCGTTTQHTPACTGAQIDAGLSVSTSCRLVVSVTQCRETTRVPPHHTTPHHSIVQRHDIHHPPPHRTKQRQETHNTSQPQAEAHYAPNVMTRRGAASGFLLSSAIVPGVV